MSSLRWIKTTIFLKKKLGGNIGTGWESLGDVVGRVQILQHCVINIRFLIKKNLFLSSW